MKKIYKILLSLAIICSFTAAIFSFSEQSGSESHDYSKSVSYKIVSIVDTLVNKDSDTSLNGSGMTFIVANALDHPIRKLAHVCIYMALGFLVITSIWFVDDFDLHFSHIFCALLIVFLVGCTDEFIQSFSGGRGATIKDAFLDTFGGALGIYAHFVIRDVFVHFSHGIKKIGKKKQQL